MGITRAVGVVATVCALLSCSPGQLSDTEATRAATRAADLYPTAFQERAPVLSPAVVDATAAEARSAVVERDEAWLAATEGLDAGAWLVGVDGAMRGTDAVTSLCRGWSAHQLGETPASCQRLRQALSRFDKARERTAELGHDERLSEDQIRDLENHLRSLPPESVRTADGRVKDDVLVDALFADDDAPGRAALEELRESLDQQLEALGQIEAAAVETLLTFAKLLRARHAADNWRQHHEWTAWLDELARSEESRTGESAEHLRFRPDPPLPATAAEAQTAIYRRLVEPLASGNADEAIAAVLPAGDQYARLLQARATYAASADSAWPRLERKPTTADLARRLAAEGYLPAESADKRAVKSALAEFQRRHQLKSTGRADKRTIAALNVPASDRLAAIEQAIVSWQKTAARPDYYIVVNIPDFHGEVWRDGRRLHRFRVVVGNRARKYKDGERKLINATPTLQAAVDRVVYNPYWNIPKRILKAEVLPEDIAAAEVDERESWLGERGYELMAAGTDWEWVRQRPGPGNALGQVKIIFPNPHEIYLHDTPSKRLFSRPSRAFSHGCVRVHQPLELARLILEQDGSYDAGEVKSLLRRRENRAIFLREKVRIFLEYITVRVDDEGHVHFLEDIYNRSELRRP